MNGRDFLSIARILASMSEESAWRSAVSRAYYAAFHAVRDFLESLGFALPPDEKAHAYLWLRLQNCGDSALENAGKTLNFLRRHRTQADYNLQVSVSHLDARLGVHHAASIIQ